MTDSLSIPEINLEFYRGDTAVKNILLTTTVGTIVATAGSPTVTVSDSDELATGYNLYDTNGNLIGTVSTVGSGTATLQSNVTTSYSGVLKVGIGWETAITDAVSQFVRVGTNDPVLSLTLASGLTFDGDWLEMDFTSLLTSIRADRYSGDLRVELLDGSIQTLITFNVVTFIKNRSSF